MAGATLGTYNCLFTVPDVVTQGDVVTLGGMASVLVLTEARSPGVDAGLAELGWRQFHGSDSEVRVVWDPAIWGTLATFGEEKVHDKGPGKYLPARHVVWQGLHHRASGTRHLVMGSHVTAGYAVTGPDAPEHQEWRDQAARKHLLTIVARSADLMTLDGRLDYHHLAGDLNAHRTKTGRWWYPVPILGSLYAPDDEVAGLDYVYHSHASVDRGLEVARRWIVTDGLASDHPAHLKRVKFPRRES